MPPLKDMTGTSIADETIHRRIGKNKFNRHVWEGTCELCGEPVKKSLSEWRRFERDKSSNACGCVRRRGLVGQRFGLITVTKKLAPRRLPGGKYAQRYEGKCDCGNIVRRFHSNLKLSQACRECIDRSRTIDLTGKTFGRLTALRRQGSDKHGRAIWICQCSCKKTSPNLLPVTSRELLKGDTQSCGCWHDESASMRAVQQLRNSKYAVWNCPFFRGRKKPWNMKRTWEVMFGRYLDAKGWDWEYEPRPYLLPSGKRYLPDFRAQCRYGEVFFDVKGWKKADAMQKIEEFSQLHRIFVIDRDELIRLTGLHPERFKKLYDEHHPWAYRGIGTPLWASRRLPTGMR